MSAPIFDAFGRQLGAERRGLHLPGSYVRRRRFEISLHERRERLRKLRAAKGLEKHARMKLQEAYPEHLFTVEVDPDHGYIFLDHVLLRHAKARYFLPYDKYEDGKGIVRLGGELLERVNLVRGELRYFQDYRAADTLARTQFHKR